MQIQLPGAHLIALMGRLTDERYAGLPPPPANDRTNLKKLQGKPSSRLDFSGQPRDIAASSENRQKRTQFYEHSRSDL